MRCMVEGANPTLAVYCSDDGLRPLHHAACGGAVPLPVPGRFSAAFTA
jgi:hypothetical protein